MGIKRRLRALALRSPMPLRVHLAVLVIVTVMPLLIFSGLTISSLEQREGATFERGATERTLAVLTAVDTELKRSITTLEALAALRQFDSDDLESFREQAKRVLITQPDWFTIDLAVSSGREALNLLRPSASDLPNIAERASFNQVLRTGKPAVGHLVQGPVTQRQEFSVRVPVVRNGITKYVLSAVVNPESIGRLILAQKLPHDWVGVVLDGNERIVTRSVAGENMIGQRASGSLQAALARSSNDWFRGTTIEGWPVYTAYSRSPFSGWTVAIGIPAAVVDTPLHRPVLYIALFGVGLLAIGLALAWLLSSKTADSIESLVGVVTNLGLGKDTTAARTATHALPTRIAEVENLKQSFLAASRLIQQRSEERDRLEQQLREDIAMRRRTEKFLQLQIAISWALTDSDTLREATPKILKAVCELSDWDLAAIWDLDRVANQLACVEVWSIPACHVPEFAAVSRQLSIAPGIGLAGRVWADGKPAWIADVTKDHRFVRAAQALKEGVHAGVCFPIKVGSDVLGVVECFSREVREPNEEHLQTLANIGNQLGQFIDRKRVEEALRESEERLRLAQTSARVGVWDWFPATGRLRFAAELDRIYGLPPDTIKTYEDWRKRIHPDDLARIEAERDAAIARHNPFELEFRILHASGAIRWVYARGSAIYDEDGEVLRALGVNVDITERKRAEEELKRFNDQLESRVAQRTSELRQANAALLRDMEERKKLEDQLLQAQKMESIGTLAGGIAHDFNNILNIIQGHAFNLRDYGAGNQDISEGLTVIHETVQRGSALVQQLLTLARKSSAKLELVNMNAVVKGLIALIAQTFPKTIELNYVPEPELPPVMADRNQIEQALLNLCVNARDAMSDGGKLTLKTQSLELGVVQDSEHAAGSYVSVEVTDTGTGMDEETQRRMFEPFFTTKGRGEGTGLGLSVVYGIVKNHNGWIDVESQAMAGTSIRLCFPAAVAEAIAGEPSAKTADQEMAPANGVATILVVEDEQNMLSLLEKLLSKRGYKIVKAADGEAAVHAYQRYKDRIDVVLLDMGLPKIAGRDVLRKIKSDNPKLKVIVTSGYPEPQLKSDIQWAQVKLLPKPYTPHQMLSTLQNVIKSEQ